MSKISQIQPDGKTVLLDHFNGTIKGTGFGALTYGESLPNLEQAVNLTRGSYIKYAFSPWYRWDGAHMWDRNEAAPGVLTEGTIEMWIKPRQYSLTLLHFNWYDAPSPPSAGTIMLFGLNTDGKLTYGGWGGNMDKAPVGKTTIPLNKWTHIVVSWGPAGTKLYVNGIADAYSTANVWPAFSGTIFAYLNDWGRGDIGLVDELHISKVARTDEEIRSRAQIGEYSSVVINQPASPTKHTPIMITGRVEAKPTKIAVNIALNKERSGYPSPLETGTGYSSDWNKWFLVDGETNPVVTKGGAYWEGVAFTYSESSQYITIDFGAPRTFNQIEVWDQQGGPNLWYRGENKKVEYWDGSKWIEITGGNWSLQQISYYENPVIYSFSPVTATKVRFSCVPKDWMWISEFKVLTTEETMPVVQVFVNGVAQAHVKVNTDGSFSIDVDLNEGENKIVVRAVDASENTIGESQPVFFILDTTPPEPPVLKSLPSTTGTAENTIEGDAEPNSDIEAFVNGVLVGTTKTENDGHFVIKVKLNKGMNEITAKATDSATNNSKSSSPIFVLYQVHPLENFPVKNIEGVGKVIAEKLKKQGIRTVNDLASSDVFALHKKVDIPLFKFYEIKRKATMALNVKIERALFGNILQMQLGEIIAMPDEELGRKANQPIEIISGLKNDISALLISLDNDIVKPITLEKLAI